jgi:hypothetical protein
MSYKWYNIKVDDRVGEILKEQYFDTLENFFWNQGEESPEIYAEVCFRSGSQTLLSENDFDYLSSTPGIVLEFMPERQQEWAKDQEEELMAEIRENFDLTPFEYKPYVPAERKKPWDTGKYKN